ncbi:PQQ-dependent sugar dehydrogenase [Nocardioides sp. GCM10028917]|uniref:PQQ-dependent sugar dehydrogenase n=1 Tax=Nocardioides sp. GCM10028917 TaxID=3273408 RepID=UPI00361F8EE2
MRSRLAVGSLVLSLGAVAGCSGTDAEPIPRVTQPTDLPSQPTPTDTPTDSESGAGAPSGSPGGPPEVVDTLVEGLEVPWGVDFLPDGQAVVTERISGRVDRIGTDGEVSPLGTVAEAAPQGEAGLLGVAVSPDFETDRTLFLYLTTDTDNRVVRAELDGARLGRTTVVLDGIPAGFIHDGGRIAFGPDGHLYVTTGETGDPELAQDPRSLAGKILRITPDGDPAPGNPDPDSPVWSLGHRNVQGLAWDDDGRLWASEFGDSEWDELNLVEKGGNYGWPQVEGAGGGESYIDPQLVWPVDQASPSGLAFTDGHLWMAGLRGQRLWRIAVSDGKASKPRAFFGEEYGRLRTVAVAPDGLLWLTTSNRDGRGEPRPADDRILRVQP